MEEGKLFIDKLRDKPEGVRRQIVLWTAILITAVIFLIWLSSLGPEVRTVPEAKAVATAEKAPGPLSVFLGFIGAEVKQIGNGGKLMYEKIR